MSRLNDLIRQLRDREPALAADIEREVGMLNDRRAFGLNFERHTPEAVELPGRRVRRGDKVRVLPPRGTTPTRDDEQLWLVEHVAKNGDTRTATVRALDAAVGGDARSIAADDLVVVAEFRDPIYPGLVSTERIERGGDQPFHTVINAENFHALQTLLFTHRGEVDCIYVDPPYNTGNGDWIYNDHYVGGDDLYRHSKWLAFMERRLVLGRELLNDAGIIIVAIGDDEHHRIRILLDQIFGASNFISNVVWQGGKKNDSRYVSNSADYMLIYARNEPLLTEKSIRWREEKPGVSEALCAAQKIWSEAAGNHQLASERWRKWIKSYKREGVASDAVTRFTSLDCDGRPIRTDANLTSPTRRPNLQYDLYHPGTHQPVKMHPNGWRYSHEIMNDRVARGLVQFGLDHTSGASGIVRLEDMDMQVPESVFERDRNSSGAELSSILGEKRFPNPKAPDVLARWIGLAAPKDALILDFFGGSGSTTEAVMRLNAADNGCRRSILVTNNEMDASSSRRLVERGNRRGDPRWEEFGVHEYVTRPRLRTVVSGTRLDGSTYNDPIAANLEFFDLTYEAPLRIASNREFTRIAPLLWMRAGSRGRRIDDVAGGWDVADAYGVIADFDDVGAFLTAMAKSQDATHAFVVTDDDWLFQSVCHGLPEHVEPVRLYEAYLRNFEFEAGGGAW